MDFKKVIKCFYVFFLCSILSLLSIMQVTSAAENDFNKSGSEIKKPYTKSVKLNIESLSMVKNTSFDLKVYNVEKTNTIQFQSMDESIVTITESKQRGAILYANNIGNTTITITIKQDGRTVSVLQCNVSVRPPAISIIFKNKRIALDVGASRKITAIIKPNNTNEMPKYTSSDESIATVSSNGKVTILSPGKAKITASISNGKSASYTLIGKNATISKTAATFSK